MRPYRLLVLIAICISYASIVQAEDNWAFTSDWVGKYPSTPVGATKSGLLSYPVIEASLKKVLPRYEASNLSQLTSEVPVREIEELVVVNKCRPHNCPSDMAMVVIDIKKKRLWVGVFSREEFRVSTRWYGTEDDYSVLPESIKKDFIARHGD